jgi:hypothetical protein
MLLGKLLRQEVLQIAGFSKVQFQFKSETIRCQVFFLQFPVVSPTSLFY